MGDDIHHSSSIFNMDIIGAHLSLDSDTDMQHTDQSVGYCHSSVLEEVRATRES